MEERRALSADATRVPARNLLEWIEGGSTIDEFLDNFPSVTREQVVGFLEQAAEAFLSKVMWELMEEPNSSEEGEV